MRHRPAARWLLLPATLIVVAGAASAAGPLPPGRQHLLTIEGDTLVAFVPQAGLDPVPIAYRARGVYFVNHRDGESAVAKGDGVAKKGGRKGPPVSTKARRKGVPVAKVVAAVDVSIHSTEMGFHQGGRTVAESRISRSGFRGQLLPGTPALDVSEANAPPPLQEILATFDTTAASLLLDEDSRVLVRKVRVDGPFRALTETLLSIHTPIPREAASWEAPTQLAMGQGQAAKGTLRFEKDRESDAREGGLVKVRVSGTLKAEGAVVGRFIKNGTYYGSRRAVV